MTRSVEVGKRRKRRPAIPWLFYRGYPYLRVSAVRLRLSRPDGAFMCHLTSPRDLTREVNRDIKRRQLFETLPLFLEAA